MDFSKLDNPVYHALSETHKDFCINFGNLKVYQPATNPFGAMLNVENSVEEIDQYFEITPKFFIFSDEKPKFSDKVEMLEVTINQMVNTQKIELPISEEIIPLNGNYESELGELMHEFYPGFYRPKTHILGNYFGIFSDKKLVAVTGERFQTNEFCEISAVVTHSEYSGRGYAQQLVTFVNNRINENGKTAFCTLIRRIREPFPFMKNLGLHSARKCVSFISEKIKERKRRRVKR